MAATDPWARKARGLLKAELKRREVNYHQLAQRLAGLGVEETHASIANKLSRGSFTAAFMIQCLEAVGCETLRLTER